MSAPVIYNGNNSKMLTKGVLLDGYSAPYPRGQKNYLAIGSSTAIGWTASSGNITVTTDTTAADLPRALTTATGIKITGVSGSTDYILGRFTLDAADYNTKLQLQFAMNALSGYVTNDFQVSVYSNTASNYTGTSTRLALSTDSSGITGLPNLEGTFKTSFDAPGSAAQYIEVRVGLNSTNTHSVVLSDLLVGPGTVIQGAAVSEAVTWTPTGSWSTNTTYYGQYWRIGSRGRFYVKISLAGAPTSATLTVNMPTGLTINNSSVDTTIYSNPLGMGASNLAIDMQVVTNGNNTSVLAVYQNIAANTGANLNTVDATHPVTWANTNVIELWWEVPVNEWAGSGTVNVVQNDVAYYYSTGNTWGTSNSSATTSQGQGGVLGGTTTPAGKFTYTFAPATPIPVGVKPVLEVSSDGVHWSPTGALVNGFIIPTLSSTGTYILGGAAWLDTSGKINVTFGQYGQDASTAWSNYGNWYWRVSVGLPGQAVGFGIVQPGTSAGLVPAAGLPVASLPIVSASQAGALSTGADTIAGAKTFTGTITPSAGIVGQTSGSAVAAGNIGENRSIAIVRTSAISLTSGSGGVDITGVTLAAGVWLVSGSIGFTGSSTTFSGFKAARSDADSANTFPANSTFGTQTITATIPSFNFAANDYIAVLPATVINISATHTYYLVASVTFGDGTCNGYGSITATRIA